MNMDIGKLLALGAAGFLGYKYFLAPKVAAPPTTDPSKVPGPTPPITNPVTTQSLVQAAAAKGGFTSGTVDEWNFYYGQARGIAAPDPGDWGFDDSNRAQILTFPEWWATASSHGLSGRSGYVRGGG